MSKHRTVAPPNLQLPEYVRDRLGNRQQFVVEHGFPPDVVGARWWGQRVPAEQSVETSDLHGHERLTRGDLFALGREASASNASGDAVLKLLWNTLAWGTGKSQRGNTSRLRSITDESLGRQRVELLKRAATSAAEGNPRDAYSALIRKGGGVIPGLGPAFFTKFLYFASEDVPVADTSKTRCLILDARVAGNLAAAGWTDMPRVRGQYSYNWYTDTYVSYCQLLDRWAREESERHASTIWPDEIERALFEGSKQKQQ